MEKFKVYSNDPYDFNDINQIIDFYKMIDNKEVLAKINETNKDKIYMRVVADKTENTVMMSLYQDRSKEASHIKLPDLVLHDAEFSLSQAEKFVDLSEYMELL